MYSPVFGLFILASIAVQEGYGLQCYTCNSESNADCLDPKKLHKFKGECTRASGQYFADIWMFILSKSRMWSEIGVNLSTTSVLMDARKIDLNAIACQKLAYTDETTKNEIVLRGCALNSKDSQGMCQYLTHIMKNKSANLFCGQQNCKTDLCNSSTNITPTVFTALITLTSLFYYYNY